MNNYTNIQKAFMLWLLTITLSATITKCCEKNEKPIPNVVHFSSINTTEKCEKQYRELLEKENIYVKIRCDKCSVLTAREEFAVAYCKIRHHRVEGHLTCPCGKLHATSQDADACSCGDFQPMKRQFLKK